MSVFPYVGVDLTAGVRPTDVAALNQDATAVVFHTIRDDDQLLGLLEEIGGEIIAIDSPLGLPRGMCCLESDCACAPSDGATGRSAERALPALGIPCFWTTKRTIIKSMIYRAMALKPRLETRGMVPLEVYPYAVKRILIGRALPAKNTPAGIACLIEGVQTALEQCTWPAVWQPSHDQLDALYCAITARLYALGQTDALGDPAEVPIIVPRPAPRMAATTP